MKTVIQSNSYVILTISFLILSINLTNQSIIDAIKTTATNQASSNLDFKEVVKNFDISSLSALSGNKNSIQTLKNTAALLQLINSINEITESKINGIIIKQQDMIKKFKQDDTLTSLYDNKEVLIYLETLLSELKEQFSIKKFTEYIEKLKNFIKKNESKFEKEVVSDIENLETLANTFKTFIELNYLKSDVLSFNKENSSNIKGSSSTNSNSIYNSSNFNIKEINSLIESINTLTNKNGNENENKGNTNENKSENATTSNSLTNQSNSDIIKNNGEDLEAKVQEFLKGNGSKIDYFKSADLNKLVEDMKALGLLDNKDINNNNKKPVNVINPLNSNNNNNYTIEKENEGVKIIIIVLICIILIIAIFTAIIFYLKQRAVISADVEYIEQKNETSSYQGFPLNTSTDFPGPKNNRTTLFNQ